jgi:hypothetical protein
MIVMLISGILVFSVSILLHAQESNLNPTEPVPIVDGIAPANLQWLDQDLRLTFFDAALLGRYAPIEIETESWFVFDIEQQALSRSSRWVLQPQIPETLENNIEPNSVAFLTPEGRYLIYASRSPQPEPSTGESFIQIYDNQTDSVIETGIPSGAGITLVGFSSLIWGGDNRFVLSITPSDVGLPAPPNLHYLDLSGGVLSVRQIAIIEFGTRSFFVVNVFDVSSDGLHVLMEGGFVGEGVSYLAIWNAQAPSNLTIIPETQITGIERLLDAQFTTHEGTQFVFFNEQGAGHYNLATDTLEIINSQVSAQHYRYAEFSPRAEVLALANDTAVYWLNLRPSQTTQTPTPTITSTGTATPTDTLMPTFTSTPTPTVTYTLIPDRPLPRRSHLLTRRQQLLLLCSRSRQRIHLHRPSLQFQRLHRP